MSLGCQSAMKSTTLQHLGVIGGLLKQRRELSYQVSARRCYRMTSLHPPSPLAGRECQLVDVLHRAVRSYLIAEQRPLPRILVEKMPHVLRRQAERTHPLIGIVRI